MVCRGQGSLHWLVLLMVSDVLCSRCVHKSILTLVSQMCVSLTRFQICSHLAHYIFYLQSAIFNKFLTFLFFSLYPSAQPCFCICYVGVLHREYFFLIIHFPYYSVDFPSSFHFFIPHSFPFSFSLLFRYYPDFIFI